MSYTESKSEGFFSRLGNAFFGILVGFVLILVSAGLLFWNEGNYVRTAQSLAEGKGAVQNAEAAKVDPALEGKLIHLTGETQVSKDLVDEAFGVSARALRLRRAVAMYQWVEHKETKKRKKLGGGEETTTTYTYSKEWHEGRIDSQSFKESGHNNPAAPDVASQDFTAEDATLGAYKLGPVMAQLEDFEGMPLTTVNLPAAQKVFRLEGGFLYKGGNAQSPQLGDVKVEYQVVKPATISIVAQQTGSTLGSYPTRSGKTILLVDSGAHDAQEMFSEAESSNSFVTWLLRGVGWVLMSVGFALLFGPVGVLADIIPFLGDLVGTGTMLFGFLLGSATSLLVIAIGWVFARPLVGILMLVAAVAVTGFAFRIGKSRRS